MCIRDSTHTLKFVQVYPSCLACQSWPESVCIVRSGWLVKPVHDFFKQVHSEICRSSSDMSLSTVCIIYVRACVHARVCVLAEVCSDCVLFFAL